MNILGINEYAHDVSVSLIVDNNLVAAVEEERFTKEKHQIGFLRALGKPPINSINWALNFANISIKDIDKIAYSWNFKPSLPNTIKNMFVSYFNNRKRSQNKRIMNRLYKESFLLRYPNQMDGYLGKINTALSEYLLRSNFIKNTFGKIPIEYVRHHLAHASSAFRASGFSKSNVIVIDGRGENESTSLYIAKDNKIEKIKSFPVENSFGALFEVITKSILGMGKFEAGKTMGLSSYGKPRKEFLKIIKILKGKYSINWNEVKKLMKYRYVKGEFTEEQKDIAATLQQVLDDASLELTKYLYEMSGYKNLCLAGGVTFNCNMNAYLLDSDYVKDIFIQPAANDAGTSLGAALEVSKTNFKMEHVYWGQEYSNDEIKKILDRNKIKYNYYDDIEGITAELINNNKIIGWFQGRMEFGPRALGNRSILANPTNPKMKEIINYYVKHREWWRPFAPSVIEEKMGKWFNKPYPSPFMLLNFEVLEDKRKEIPAVTHFDGTARVQSVNKKINKRYYNLLKNLEKINGVPIVLNTSFNDREPILRTPEECLKTFFTTGLDCLVIENYLIKKNKI